MKNFEEQILRIKKKLKQAKRADAEFKVFGSKSHEYTLHPTISEKDIALIEEMYHIQLPISYRIFIREIGNGGAGPFYGIYKFGLTLDSPAWKPMEDVVRPTKIFPKMTDEYWEELKFKIDSDVNDEMTEDEYDDALGEIFGGILKIGSQGCTYSTGLILNGKYKGKIVNLDEELQKPYFCYEDNFLDWYERWLDEIISGDLLENSSWFGFSRGGTVETLLTGYFKAATFEEREEFLFGILNKKKVDANSLKMIEQEYIKTLQKTHQKTLQSNRILLQILTKFDYQNAKKHLEELASSDLDGLFKLLYSYAKKDAYDWFEVIRDNIHQVDNSDTFRFCMFLLDEIYVDYASLILPFTKSTDVNIRQIAYSQLGKLPEKKKYAKQIAQGLYDTHINIIRNTLQALFKVNDAELLSDYKNVADRFPVERDYILSNLAANLESYNMTVEQLREMNMNQLEKVIRRKKGLFFFDMFKRRKH